MYLNLNILLYIGSLSVYFFIQTGSAIQFIFILKYVKCIVHLPSLKNSTKYCLVLGMNSLNMAIELWNELVSLAI